METIIITILFISTLAFLYLYQDKRDKAEEKRFREFVLANKSKTIEEYATALPTDEPLEQPISDEVIELGDANPNDLLKAIKQEHEN